MPVEPLLKPSTLALGYWVDLCPSSNVLCGHRLSSGTGMWSGFLRGSIPRHPMLTGHYHQLHCPKALPVSKTHVSSLQVGG